MDSDNGFQRPGWSHIPEGAHTDAGDKPQHDQIIPLSGGEAVSHLFQEWGDQVNRHQGIEEPVGHQHRSVEQGDDLTQGGLGPGQSAVTAMTAADQASRGTRILGSRRRNRVSSRAV